MNTSKKQINFNLNDFLPFIDGLDIAINFSLVIFLSSFLLESLDTRIAVVILCFVTSLSLISRIFDLKISKLLEKLKIDKINLFLILFFLYFIPVIIQKEFPIFLSIGIFVIFRFFTGIIISLSYRNVLINEQKFVTNILQLKYWILIFLGIACGSLFYNLINEIYSNDFINNGGWKILYVIVISLLLVIFVFSKFHLKKNVIIMLDSNNIKNNSFVTNYINSFILFIPILCFLLFSFSNWLPKFSNPDNLYFLSYGFLYLFLTNLILFFITPLANIVGRRKSVIFFNISVLIISSICSFVNHSSSYSIDFLKFFLSLVSSFTICSFILQQQIDRTTENSCISSLNLSFLTAAIFASPFVFFSVNFSINYSVIYIFLSIVYFINYIRLVFKKDG